MVDLDNFKQINDAFGHHAGDEVLKTIASHLSESVRPSDAVARWGGDEFVVLLHPIRQDELEAVAKRIQQSIVQDERLTSFDLSVSMGGALTSSDYRALLKVADENLIEMKNHTKNDYKITRV
jgi:diguanylate cyclase (GGDEF)-like protein